MKTINAILFRSFRNLRAIPLLVLTVIGLSAPSLRADTVYFSSIDNVTTNRTGYSDYGMGGIGYATGVSDRIGPGNYCRYVQNYTGSHGAWCQVQWLGGTTGSSKPSGGAYAVYDFYTAHTSTFCSSTLVMSVAYSNCGGNAATTTAFQSTGGDVWHLIGQLWLDGSMTAPTVKFTYSSGTVTSTSRWYSDNWKLDQKADTWAVHIDTQPTASTTLSSGSSFVISVGAGNTTGPTYQWSKSDSGPISGATLSSYTINPVAAGDAGTYTCDVAGTYGGTVTSANAVLTVATLPSATALARTTGSSSQTYGSPLTFTATVSGSGTPGGNVIFKDGATSLATNAVVSGSAAYTSYTDLKVSGSPHFIVAYYQGDGTYCTSDSSASPIAQAITAKALTVSGLTAANKVYDGTTAESLGGAAVFPTAEAPGTGSTSDGAPYDVDTVSPANTATGAFATKDVGTGKPVTTSVTAAGSGSNNYSVTQQEGLTADINQTNLTVTGITANNKPYDGTTTAALNTSSAALVGVVSGDDVTLQTADAIGAFADPAVGTNKVVNITGLTITGTAAANYTLAQPTTLANITEANPPPVIVLTAPADNASFAAPATIDLAATVTTNGNTINYVSFYKGGTLLSNVTTSPYVCSWTAALASANSLWAQAVYNGGSLATSATNSITVTSPPPVIVLTAPADNAGFTSPANISLLATVTSNYNAISYVGFYNWGTNLIASVTNAPYAYSWTNVSAGVYSLTARLAYSAGSTVDSVASAVTVTNCPLPGIKTQPLARIHGPGGNTTFQFTATNATACQWRFNGADMAGQTNASLSLTNIQMADFGTYTVLVSGGCGSVLSAPARLIMAAQPTVTAPSLSLSTFSLTFTTEPGPVYTVECKSDLRDPVWQLVATVAGSGVPITITDNAATNTAHFYRIHAQ